MKKILIIIFLLVLFSFNPIKTYSIDMPGITSNETVISNRNNNNFLTNIKNDITNYENDSVMYYAVITFISLSFIVLFILYKKGKRIS